MLTQVILMVLLSIFVFYCSARMVKLGDDIHAYFFIALYIYTIFTQVGYVFFPEFSYELCYFGPEAFYPYWIFMFLSFVSCYFFYCRFKKQYRAFYYYVDSTHDRTHLFYMSAILLLLFCALYFYRNPDKFGWGGAKNMGDSYFLVIFRVFTSVTFILYTLVRQKFNFKIALLFGLCIILFSSVTITAGARSSLVSFFVAFVFFELIPLNRSLKKNKWKIIFISACSYFFIKVLFAILELRNYSSAIDIESLLSFFSENQDLGGKMLAEDIIKQDYYAPSHTLFIAIHHDFVQPLTTLFSNICNTFIGLHQAYLTEYLVGVVEGTQTRGVGWAFHLFVEGYCFAGWLGILYNGIIWNLFLALLIRITKSNSPELSRVIYSYLAAFVIDWTRTQSCIMLQSIWFSLIPFIILLSWAYNKRIHLYH